MFKVSLTQNIREIEGVWVPYPAVEGVRFRVARAGNRTFLNATDKFEAPFRKQIARGTMPTEKQIEVQCRAMAEGILLGWEGITDENGPLEYSTDNAYALLRWYPEIREFVFETAVNAETFRRDETEATAKKSPSSSNGPDSGANT